jgi:hypothetical protein
MSLSVGDWVEVRSKEEILRTLDNNGRLENMPFMPEMFEYCGKRLAVGKRAHKSCDTINPVSTRGLVNSVFLGNIRCNGSAHGGCQAQCAVFWKEAWLKPIRREDGETSNATRTQPVTVASRCTEQDVRDATTTDSPIPGKIRYRCQATDFPLYSTRLRTRQISQFIEDYTSGNTTLGEMLRTGFYFLARGIGRPKREEDGGQFADLYDRFRWMWGGVPYPRRIGKLQNGEEGPISSLDLKPGDLVRVKSFEEILGTIDGDDKNRGMRFDAEMVPYCGGVFRVRSHVEKFLNEKTGIMQRMKTPAVILEGAWCKSRYSEYRAFCPRAIYSWWREVWLERAPEGAIPSGISCTRASDPQKKLQTEEASR